MPSGRADIQDMAATPRPRRPFIGILFECCHVYGRLYRRAVGTAYEGGCPRCARRLRIPVGSGGTSRRFFRAR